ncbi:MAG: PDGLE domain-containing protein [Methanoregula sp.]|nr:PDGLE domain-containing protein [Methanoregula sp.]
MSDGKPTGARKAWDVVIGAGIVIAIGIAIFAPFYASTNPDGLDATFLSLYGAKSTNTPVLDNEKLTAANVAVTEKTGNKVSWQAPFTNYTLPGLDKPGEVLAIVFGVVILFVLGFGVSRFIARKN